MLQYDDICWPKFIFGANLAKISLVVWMFDLKVCKKHLFLNHVEWTFLGNGLNICIINRRGHQDLFLTQTLPTLLEPQFCQKCLNYLLSIYVYSKYTFGANLVRHILDEYTNLFKPQVFPVFVNLLLTFATNCYFIF